MPQPPVEYREISAISVDKIDFSQRLRSVNDDAVVELTNSMSSVGLMNPIWVTPWDGSNHRLVAGLHRLEAAKRLGWTKIDARIVDLSEIKAKLAEIAENLHRAELTAGERADQIAEWIRLTDTGEVSAQVETKSPRWPTPKRSPRCGP